MIDTWGDKPESQISNRTIAQAIADYVNDHLNDPDAHLEIGQSLQSHKASEIIDHIVGSVVADKLSMTEFVATTIFESLSGFNITGDVSNDNFPGCQCSVSYPDVNESSAYTTPQVPQQFINDTVDLLFQIMCRFDMSNTHFHAWFGYLGGETTAEIYFGYQIRDGILHAFFSDGSYSYDQVIIGVVFSDDNIYRVQYNATSRTLTWYVNGSQVAFYIVNVSSSWNGDVGPSFGLKLTQSNDGNLLIGLINFSRQI